MVSKHLVAAAACAALVAMGSVAPADEYRAGEVFDLDLSKAVLSPKLIGPPAEFAPVPVEARTDAKQAVVEPKATEPNAEPKADHRRVVRTTRVVERHVTTANVTATHAVKPRGAARAKLARRGNPLNAQARDTRVQTWPCRSGGICNWR